MVQADTTRPEILYSVKAQRGPTLRCKGWKQETLLRMLENNMENAEKPEELVIYGGIGKCARNWESYHAIVRDAQGARRRGDPRGAVGHAGGRLPDAPAGAARGHGQHQHHEGHLADLLRSAGQEPHDVRPVHGRPVGVHRHAGRHPGDLRDVLGDRAQVLRRLARRPHPAHRRRRRHGWQPDPRHDDARRRRHRHRRRRARHQAAHREALHRSCRSASLDEAIALAKEHAAAGKAIGIAVVGNAADLFEEALDKGFLPDIVTEMCPCHDPIAYIPSGFTSAGGRGIAPPTTARSTCARRVQTMMRQLRAMNRYFARRRAHLRVRHQHPQGVPRRRDARGRGDDDPGLRRPSTSGRCSARVADHSAGPA